MVWSGPYDVNGTFVEPMVEAGRDPESISLWIGHGATHILVNSQRAGVENTADHLELVG
jgi:hypothetical protein